jgi:hypothetical protein
MRKAQMQAVIDGLKKHNEDLRDERDNALSSLHTKVNKLTDDVAGVAEAVRSALLGQAARDKPPAPRNGKAASS